MKNGAISWHHKRQGKTDLDWVDQKHEILEKNKEASGLASRKWLKISKSNCTSKVEVETRLKKITKGLNSKEMEAAKSDYLLGIFNCVRKDRTKAGG